MKKIALILMALTVIAGGVLLYALFHSSLTVTAKGMQAISAADRAADFDQHRLSLISHALGQKLEKKKSPLKSEYLRVN